MATHETEEEISGWPAASRTAWYPRLFNYHGHFLPSDSARIGEEAASQW